MLSSNVEQYDIAKYWKPVPRSGMQCASGDAYCLVELDINHLIVGAVKPHNGTIF